MATTLINMRFDVEEGNMMVRDKASYEGLYCSIIGLGSYPSTANGGSEGWLDPRIFGLFEASMSAY